MSAVRRLRRRLVILRSLADDIGRQIDFTDRTIEINEDRLSGLEEIAAARWPRSWLLRRRLARSLRASVAGYATERDFGTRRAQAVSDELIMETQRRRRGKP